MSQGRISARPHTRSPNPSQRIQHVVRPHNSMSQGLKVACLEASHQTAECMRISSVSCHQSNVACLEASHQTAESCECMRISSVSCHQSTYCSESVVTPRKNNRHLTKETKLSLSCLTLVLRQVFSTAHTKKNSRELSPSGNS